MDWFGPEQAMWGGYKIGGGVNGVRFLDFFRTAKSIPHELQVGSPKHVGAILKGLN